MTDPPLIPSSNSSHYDLDYYNSHYGNMSDPDTYAATGRYWSYVLFKRLRIAVDSVVLDFGCGPGHVTAALPNAVLFDPSPTAMTFAKERGRVVVESEAHIREGFFDVVLSSHSLEHSTTPFSDLMRFRRFVKVHGLLILVLPVETVLRPALRPDSNQHFQCWTFQTITNLLVRCGWLPFHQECVYAPWGLSTLRRVLSLDKAVRLAAVAGRLRRQFPAMLTLARAV